MKQKTGRKLLGILLSLALVLGLMPGMGLTAYAAPTETLLTTITATGDKQASYSTANVANVSFSYTAGGSSAYLADWGWWGYGWTATVTPADGYTITKCVFYDDANRKATDSEAPFVVETTEKDKTPRINGTPIDGGNYQSKGIKKIEVYGYAAPTHNHAFTYTASGATITATCGNTSDCPLAEHKATLTIVAPTLTTYDQTGEGISAAATLTGLSDFNTATGKTIAATDIKYVGRDGTTYEENATAPTGAGKYTAKITVEEKTASVDYEIAKVNQSVIAPTAKTGLVYNGESQKLIDEPAVTYGNNAGIRYQLNSGDWTANIPYATGAGTYTVSYKVLENENFNEYAGTAVTVTIAKANQEIISPTGRENLKYTGYEQNLLSTLPVVIKGNTLSIAQYRIGNEGAWSPSLPTGTAVGEYAVFYKIAEDGNYNEYNGSISVSIAKAANPATVSGTASVTKGGKTVDLAGNVTLNGATGEVTYAIDGANNGCTLVGSVLTSGADTGSVTVNVNVAEDGNYNALATKTITVTITDKQPQTITASDVTATYGDTDKTVSASTNGNGAISYAVKEGSDVVEVNSSTGALTIKKVGTATVIVTAAETDNYAAATKEVTVTINKANAVAATVTANNRTYDGTAQPLVTVIDETTGGEMQYALGTKDAATEEYTTSIPAKTDAGTYYVWYKVVGDDNHTDSDAACVTATIAAPVYYDAPTPSTPAAETVTIPVSGEDETVNVKVEVKDDTATVKEADVDKVLSAEEVGTVTVDVSTLKENVNEVVIPNEMLEKVADAVADEENTADGLEVKLPAGSVAFDADALATITEQADGKDLTLHLDDVKVTELTSAQQEAVSELEIEVVLDAYLTSGGKRISDFNGGSAIVKIPYTLKDGQTAQGLVVWYVAADGTRTQVPASYDGKNVVFTVPHFSNYVIAYDAEKAAECPKDAACPISAFDDADPTAWYHDGVHFALENGMMNGVGDNKFDPDGTTTRAMIVTILYRLEGSPAVTAANPFDDVADGTWYTDAVLWAAENKIVSGYGDGKFGPDDPITREQLAAILYRYEQSKGGGFVGAWMFLLDYPDAAEISSWADEAMHWCVMHEIINGKDGRLVPGGNATRAEAATMLMRYLSA